MSPPAEPTGSMTTMAAGVSVLTSARAASDPETAQAAFGVRCARAP